MINVQKYRCNKCCEVFYTAEMIELHKDKKINYVNPDKVVHINQTNYGETMIYLGSQYFVVVDESPEQVVEKIMKYKLAMNEHKAFTQENKRLRKALQDIILLDSFTHDERYPYRTSHDEMVKIAQNALKESECE